MPRLTPAEKQKRYREKLKQNKEKYAVHLEKDRQRKDGAYKPVSEMTEREHRRAKKNWRTAKRNAKVKNQTKDNVQNNISRQKMQAMVKSAEEAKLLKQENECLKAQLKDEIRLKEKYKKRSQRLTPKSKNTDNELKADDTPRSKTKKLLRCFKARNSPKCSVRKTLTYHFALTAQLKSCKKYTKQFLQGIKHGNSILKKYKCLSRARQELSLHKYNQKTYLKRGTITSRSKKVVEHFFLRNDVSRMLAGKKNTVTRKGIKKQRRVLNDTLHNLFLKFSSENKLLKISFISFYRCKPFYVQRPRDKDRETCSCKLCSNIEFLARSTYDNKLHDTSVVGSLLRQCVCSVESQMCMFGTCKKCRGKNVPLASVDIDHEVECNWLSWETVKERRNVKNQGEKVVTFTKKVTKTGSLRQIKTEFDNLMKAFRKHYFIMCNQFKNYANVKDNLTEKEAMIHIDFAENYVGKYASEIQSAHFGASKSQVVIHTGFFYTGSMDEIQSFGGISDSLNREPSAIWAYLNPILIRIRIDYPLVECIHFFSDGPSTQYKQKKNFYFFTTEVFKHGFKRATWNFSCAGHGKGIPDGIGATIKRSADQGVKFGNDIITANGLITYLCKSESSIYVYEIFEKDMVPYQEILAQSNIKPVPKTLEIHQLFTDTTCELKYRDISCICKDASSCTSHKFKTFSFESYKPQANANTIKSQIMNESTEVNKKQTNTCTIKSEIMSESNEEVIKKQNNACATKSEIMPESTEEDNNWAYNYGQGIQALPFKEEVIESENMHKEYLKNLQDCQTYSELQRECEVQSLKLQEIYGREWSCKTANLPIEMCYSKFVPEDFKKRADKHYFPVNVRADGDCLCASGDVFATGKDANPYRIRLKIIHEQVLNEDYYLQEENLLKGYDHPSSLHELSKAFAMYSEHFDPSNYSKLDADRIKSIYRTEILSILKPRTYLGIWQAFALASVLKMTIDSVYPDLGNPLVRKHLNRKIEPRVKVSTDTAKILWTSTRLLGKLNWIPNHFVPLLPFTK